MPDRLLIAFERLTLALDTSEVAGVAEAFGIPFVPGQSGIVEGIISHRNEPVAVVDLKMAFFGARGPRTGFKKIIVVRDGGRLLGLDTGGAQVTLSWGGEPSAAQARAEMRFTRASVKTKDGGTAFLIDTAGLFSETERLLSTDKRR